jgi:hypothetical protein
MDNIILESTLTKSETFNDFNNLNSVSQVAKAQNLIKNLEPLKVDDIETAYVQIKQMPNLLSRQAIRQFDQGDIVLLYNKNVEQRMVDIFPFLTFLVKGSRYTTYIFMDKFMTMDRNEKYHVNTSILHDLLRSAVVSNAIKANYQRLASNLFLENILTDLYKRLFIRVINREYSIAADKILSDKIGYWVGKFFLKNIFQTASPDNAIENLLLRDIRYLDEIQINEIKSQYDKSNPSKISELIEFIKPVSPRLTSLNKASFINRWIDYFYPRALLAMDNIEYFIFMIIAILGGNNIVSIAPSELVKETKNINNFIPELIKLCS